MSNNTAILRVMSRRSDEHGVIRHRDVSCPLVSIPALKARRREHQGRKPYGRLYRHLSKRTPWTDYGLLPLRAAPTPGRRGFKACVAPRRIEQEKQESGRRRFLRQLPLPGDRAVALNDLAGSELLGRLRPPHAQAPQNALVEEVLEENAMALLEGLPPFRPLVVLHDLRSRGSHGNHGALGTPLRSRLQPARPRPSDDCSSCRPSGHPGSNGRFGRIAELFEVAAIEARDEAAEFVVYSRDRTVHAPWR